MLRPQGICCSCGVSCRWHVWICGCCVTWGLVVAKQKVLEAAGCAGQGAQT